MQDVTTLPFWRVLERRGGPDVYVTEYFRVHSNSRPEAHILRSIRELDSPKPVIAQLIGNEVDHLKRTAHLLKREPISGIDLNLGCPAPNVCGKNSGGALLRNPEQIRAIIQALREVVTGTLTLKTRIGFESAAEFEDLLALFASLPIDGLAIHGRTVRERYQSTIHVPEISRAAQSLPFPVIANGSIVSAQAAISMHLQTSAAGLMIGRGGIRNPWIFEQIRQTWQQEKVFRPSMEGVFDYIMELFEEVAHFASNYHEIGHVQRMKKFTNYIASGISEGRFEAELRRARTESQFGEICRSHLSSREPFPEEPLADGKLFCGFEPLLLKT